MKKFKSENLDHPLFEWNTKVCLPSESEKNPYDITKALTRRIQKHFPDYKPLPKNEIESYLYKYYRIPSVHARVNVSTTVFNPDVYRRIMQWANHSVYSIGAGSGYHEWEMSRFIDPVLTPGNVFAADIKNTEWHYLFYPVEEFKIKNAKKIAKSGGCAFYCWMYRKFPEIDLIEKSGIRKLVVIGCYELSYSTNGEIYEDLTICPKFEREGWKLVESIQNEFPYMPTDVTTWDIIDFYEREPATINK